MGFKLSNSVPVALLLASILCAPSPAHGYALSPWQMVVRQWKNDYVNWASDNGCPLGEIGAIGWLPELDDTQEISYDEAITVFHNAMQAWQQTKSGCQVMCPSADDPGNSNGGACLWDGVFPYGSRVPVGRGSSSCATLWMIPPMTAGAPFGTCGCASPDDPKTNTEDPNMPCVWSYGDVPNGKAIYPGQTASCRLRMSMPYPINPSASHFYCSCVTNNDPGYFSNNCAYSGPYVPPNMQVVDGAVCFFPTTTSPDPITGVLKCEPRPGSPVPPNFLDKILSIPPRSFYDTSYWGIPYGSDRDSTLKAVSNDVSNYATADIRADYTNAILAPTVAENWLARMSSDSHNLRVTAAFSIPACNDACFDGVTSLLSEEFSDLSILSAWREVLDNVVISIQNEITAQIPIATSMVASSVQNPVTPPKPIAKIVMDIVGLALGVVATVVEGPLAIAIGILTGIAGDISSDPNDPYWNDKSQLYETIAVITSKINDAVMNFKASMRKRFSAVATNPLQLRMLASTLSSFAQGTLPTAADTATAIRNADIVIQQRLVRLFFAAMWSICYATTYGTRTSGDWYINCDSTTDHNYKIPYGRWYTMNVNMNNARWNIPSWFCPSGHYNNGEIPNTSVFVSAGNIQESSLISGFMTMSTDAKQPQNMQNLLNDGWSQAGLVKCPDCGQKHC